MELHNREISRSSTDSRPEVNLPNEQFIYQNRINAFDPNLCSAAEYSPPPPVTYAPTDSAITYSNVIFLPTIALSDRPAVDEEAVKNEIVTMESSTPPPQFKYVVASDARYASTFMRNGEIVEGIAELAHANEYVEPASHMIAATAGSVECEGNMGYHVNEAQPHAGHHAQYSYVDTDYMQHHSRDKHGRSDAEIVLQDANGQLYRHNVYVNHGDAINSVELMPTLISEEMVNGIEYAMHETYDHHSSEHDVAYEMHSNIDGTLCPAAGEKQAHHSNGTDAIGLIYDNYKEQSQQYTMLEAIDQNNVIQNGDGMHSNDTKTPYTTKCAMDKDQQRILLESTMSPLLAAVNDITAREERYRESYLAQNKVATSKNSTEMDYYYSNGVGAHTSQPSQAPANGHGLRFSGKPRTTSSKSIYLGECENTRTSCASPVDEYVDINEMEFIDKPNGGKEENLLMRRSRRKKTNKKCEELMVADKHVPNRAWATLPTSYLFFGSDNDDSPQQVIFAKKDIPLRTKFGPFEGDVRTLDDDSVRTYRATHRGLPLLFISPNSILDVSNEKTSNWMRFVYLATKYIDQNLLLYEVEGKLYFKSCQFIAPKQQLRVGYSKEYAKKYKLPLLVPERQAVLEKQNPWPCAECNKRFSSIAELDDHANAHKATKMVPAAKSSMSTPTKQRPENGEVTLPSSASKNSNHRLNTGAIRKRKLALSKNSRTSGPTVRYACCYCSKVFTKFLSYKKHTNAVHSVDVDNKRLTLKAAAHKCKENISGSKEAPTKEVAKKWFVCSTCQRYFATQERLEKHQMLQCIKSDSKSVQCEYCQKRVATASALTMHMRTHSTKNGLFECPFCKDRYQNTLLFKEHVKIHMTNGTYQCPHCEKDFAKYSAIRKHMQLNHSAVRFKCQSCPKEFKSRYKLKEHRLCHSDVRQFLCDDCGKQFKRKDKLREHILKVHAVKCDSAKIVSQKMASHAPNTGRMETSNASDQVSPPEGEQRSEVKTTGGAKSAKFRPKVAPTDYQRFIYKCNDCMLGFKRRGMLVNHMAKQHPTISIESVPELNLPILQTQRCYYCTYCEKVYKSSSKRKAHILKYHPGRELPQSTRQKGTGGDHADGTLPDPSFSESISSVTTHAHQCRWCYKQYASKTRLLQHQRKQHSGEIHRDSGATRCSGLFQAASHHDHPNYEMNDHDQQCANEHKMHNYNEPTYSHQRYIDFEPENKLLKLSSAALDFEFFDEKGLIAEQMSLPKVDVNFKVVGHEYADTSASSNCDLNPLPQLFEEICTPVKSTSNGHTNRMVDGSRSK